MINWFEKEKTDALNLMANCRNGLISILYSVGCIEDLSIELKRDLGDFVEYVKVFKIDNGNIYFEPNEYYPSGKEHFNMLSVNELYDLIVGLKKVC